MEQKNIGKIISKIRKEKELTQQQLGDILGVSSKTISKWETGNSIPDITILKRISQEFNITIDELLTGEIKKYQKTIKAKFISLIFFLMVLAIIIISIYYLKTKNNKEPNTPENNCTVIKTYDIKNIKESNDGNYRYITISEYQVEGIFTIKIPRSISENLKPETAYIFTLKTTEDNKNSLTDKLFTNGEIINIQETDKVGMERESISYCDNIVNNKNNQY